MSGTSTRMSLVALVVLVAVAGASGGCFWAPDLAMVRKDLERQLPGVNFEKDIELTLGPVSLAFARMASRVVPDAREARGYLRHVKRIELAIYNTDSVSSLSGITMPRRLEQIQSDDEWETAVRIRKKNELGWVLYRMENDSVKELYVVILNDNELVLVKAEGDLDYLVACALSESGVIKDLPATL